MARARRVAALLLPVVAALVLVAPARAASVASAPRSVSAAGADRSVVVNWVPPADDGGHRVADYRVQVRRFGVATWRTFDDGRSVRQQAVVTGLVNGRRYEVRVAAVTSAGRGAWSAVRRATPVAVPGPVGSLLADATGVVTWEPPVDTGGLPLTDYRVAVRPAGATTWELVSRESGDLTTGEEIGAAPFAREVRVAAVNGRGRGAFTLVGVQSMCDDNDPVTDDSYDEASGTCEHVEVLSRCDDGDTYTIDFHDTAAKGCGHLRAFYDYDNDGFLAEYPQGGRPDCDDTNPAVNPDAVESTNGVDDDCDTKIDEDPCDDNDPYTTDTHDDEGCVHARDFYDFDDDGYLADTTYDHDPGSDCNDSDPAVNPGAAEMPFNSVDDDCNGKIDDVPLPP